MAKKAEQGQKRWQKHGLQEHKAWEEVLPVWQRLRWYRYTGAQQGGALFAHWPDSDQWGPDVWTANVPDAIKELAMRVGLPVPPASASQSELVEPTHSTNAAPDSTAAAAGRSTAADLSTLNPSYSMTEQQRGFTAPATFSAPPSSNPSSNRTGLRSGTHAVAPEVRVSSPSPNTTELQADRMQTSTPHCQDAGKPCKFFIQASRGPNFKGNSKFLWGDLLMCESPAVQNLSVMLFSARYWVSRARRHLGHGLFCRSACLAQPPS